MNKSQLMYTHTHNKDMRAHLEATSQAPHTQTDMCEEGTLP